MKNRTEKEDKEFFYRTLIWGADEDAQRALNELIERLRFVEKQIEMFKRIDEFKNWIKS